MNSSSLGMFGPDSCNWILVVLAFWSQYGRFSSFSIICLSFGKMIKICLMLECFTFLVTIHMFLSAVGERCFALIHSKQCWVMLTFSNIYNLLSFLNFGFERDFCNLINIFLVYLTSEALCSTLAIRSYSMWFLLFVLLCTVSVHLKSLTHIHWLVVEQVKCMIFCAMGSLLINTFQRINSCFLDAPIFNRISNTFYELEPLISINTYYTLFVCCIIILFAPFNAKSLSSKSLSAKISLKSLGLF